MKKLLFSALIAVSISTGSFAQDVIANNQKAIDNFESLFSGASNVAWVAKEKLTIASFVQDQSKVEVFYNPDGDLIATTKEVKMDDLPTFAKRIISKKYSDYTVKEVFLFKADEETNYFISIENEKESLVLKVNQGSISAYSQTSKS